MQAVRDSDAHAFWLALGQAAMIAGWKGPLSQCHCVSLQSLPFLLLAGAGTCSPSMPRCRWLPSLCQLGSSGQLCCGKWRAEVADHQLSPGFHCCLLEKRRWHFINSLSAWSQGEIVDTNSITAPSRSPWSEPLFCFLLYLVSYWSLSYLNLGLQQMCISAAGVCCGLVFLFGCSIFKFLFPSLFFFLFQAGVIRCRFTEHSGCEHKHLDTNGSHGSYTSAALRLGLQCLPRKVKPG